MNVVCYVNVIEIIIVVVFEFIYFEFIVKDNGIGFDCKIELEGFDGMKICV